MFDVSQPIPLKLITPDGDKEVTVNFPTDDQLADRSAKMKLVVRQLGRGKSVTEPQQDHKLDADLFSKIKVDGEDIDEFYAAQVIARLTRCEVTDSRREGNRFVVELKVPGAKTVHTMKIPSAKQVQQYSRASFTVIEGRHGMQEMKLNLRAGEELYDALLDKTEGYAGAVPIVHKSSVISEVMVLLNQDQDADGEIEGF